MAYRDKPNLAKSDYQISASVITVNTNEWHRLETYLPSLLKNKGNYEIIISDNGSTDNSIEKIKTYFPGVTVLENGANLGFAEANNRAAQMARGEFLVFINPDTILAPDMLINLLEPFKDPTVGLVTGKILLMNTPGRINTCGNNFHISGITQCRGLNEHPEKYHDFEEVDAVSGAAFAIRHHVFDRLEGFDRDFFVYMEETDLSIRARIAGWQCVYQPKSIIYHDYKLRFGPKKIFFQERNRYFLILKSFHWFTIVMIFPTLLLAEVVTWGFSIMNGMNSIHNKIDAYLWILVNWRSINEKRKKVQALRRVKDRYILKRSVSRINFDQVSGKALSTVSDIVFNNIFSVLKFIQLLFIWW